MAEKYPDMIDNVIMVGSGPLEDKYVSEILLKNPVMKKVALEQVKILTKL